MSNQSQSQAMSYYMMSASLAQPYDSPIVDSIASLNANQPHQNVDLTPQLRLSLAVVCTAIVDIHRGTRRRYARESAAKYALRKQDAIEAKHFLLHGLNDEENHWGAVLRLYGMKPMTRERLACLVRNRAFLTLTQLVEAA